MLLFVILMFFSPLFLKKYRYARYTMVCLSIRLFMDILVVASFWLLQKKVLWIFKYMSLCGYMLIFLSGRYLGAEWLHCMLSICLTFNKSLNCFPKLYHFTFPLAICEFQLVILFLNCKCSSYMYCKDGSFLPFFTWHFDLLHWLCKRLTRNLGKLKKWPEVTKFAAEFQILFPKPEKAHFSILSGFKISRD